ncbi:hypothetical protein GGQ82_004215 [Sphingobium olei]
MTHQTRESWLNAVAQGMAPLFEALDAPLPDRVRVAIGFTSRGAKAKAIGECWDNRLRGDYTKVTHPHAKRERMVNVTRRATN